VPGIYRVGKDGGVEVDLLGRLAGGPELEMAVVQADVEGDPVTLFTCHRRTSRGAGQKGQAPALVTWWVGSAIENAHLTKEDDARFDRLGFTSPHLRWWAERDIVKWDYKVEDDGQVTNSYSWPQDQPETAVVPGATIELRTLVGHQDVAFGDKTIMQRQAFSVSSDVPLPYDELWTRYVRPLAELISLAAGERTDIEVLWTRLSSEISARIHSGCRIRRHNGRSVPEPDHGLEMLWTLPDWNFADGVARWFAIDEKAPAATVLFELAQDEGSGWATDRFFNAVSAAEALHRGLYGTAEPTDRQKQRLEAIYAQVTSDQRKWLRWKPRHSHEPTLQDRLAELVKDTGHPAWRFIPDAASWSSAIVKARNDLAHGREEATNVLRDPARVHAMTETLIAVLALRLMRELGFTEERTSELTLHQMRYWGNLGQLLRAS